MIKTSKVTFLSSLGVGLEYYDFIIYGLLSPYLSPLFFRDNEPIDGLLKVFAIFALGYLARPFGGILFGIIADRMGRRTIFIIIMLLMAVSTFCIGLLPTAAHIGIFAPILLSLLRVIQGISFGAELPGAITIVCEYSHQKNIGLHCSYVLSGTGIGAALASIVLMILTTFLDSQEMREWGWRVPFIFGGILAIVSYIIRFHLQESPAFQLIKKQRRESSFLTPFLELTKNHKKEIFLCTLLNFITSSFVIISIYQSTYLSTFFDYPSNQIFQAMTIGLIITTPLLPLLGWLGDVYNRENVMCFAIILFLILGYFVFHLVNHRTFFSLVCFVSFLELFSSIFISCTLPLTASIFPTQIRFSGIGFCYNLAYMLASIFPIVITNIIKTYDNTIIPYYILSIISIAIMYLLMNKRMINFEKNENDNFEIFLK